jgi:hypothetical protein
MLKIYEKISQRAKSDDRSAVSYWSVDQTKNSFDILKWI